jgi:2-polyprenyl-6-methoxyphenol hydroxylase-like FAD-dependent oxidoreductase
LIPQWRVEEILRERLGELGVTVEYGSELAGLKQDSDGVHACLQTASGSETDSFSYAIGCDGASSTVRKLLEIGFLGRTDETVRMLTADVEVSGLDRDFWHWWPGTDGKLLALCPLAATDTLQLQAGVAPDTAGELPLAQIQALVDERSGRSGRSDIRVRRVEWQSIWRFNVRMVDRYHAGRVFLAGDSAHVHSPAGGLGMHTGIQDAYNLGWKIAHVLRGAPAGCSTPTSRSDSRSPPTS